MKRKIPFTLAALALFGLPACGGGGSAAGGKLIPEQATMMGGIDVAGLMKTSLYADNKAEVEKRPEWKEMQETAKACNLDIEKAVSSVLVGTDGKDGFAAVITGDGIGDEKNLNCLNDKAKEKNGGKNAFTIVDDGGKKALKMEGDKAGGWIVDGRTVVIASKPWQPAVKDLIDGKGKPASEGPNKDLFARADQSKHIWGAGLVPANVASDAKAMGADLKDMSGSLDFSSGLNLQATAGLASAEQATNMKKMADEQMKGAEMFAGMVGLAEAVKRVQITTKDATISVAANVTNEEIKGAKDKAGALMGMFGGGGGGGGMAEPPAEPATPPPAADPAAAPAPTP
jgi:hypothetical protein